MQNTNTAPAVGRQIKRYLFLILLIVLSASFQTLGMKADIGVCALWDSVSLNVYELTGLKVGTFTIIANCILVLLQLIILRKNFHPRRLLQVPAAICFGLVTNFVYYRILVFDLGSYPVRLMCYMISCVGLALWAGGHTYLNLVQMPPEGFCYVVNKKYGISFSKLRMLQDFTCIIISLLLSLLFGLSLKVREGTVIGMLLLGPIMGFFMEHFWKGRIEPEPFEKDS